MSKSAVSVQGLSKKYRIGRREPYGRLTETLWSAISSPLARGRSSDPEFWALRDVTFDVPHGASVGIVGRNGAGKSTLLKILSQITEPTTGRALITGRVASLLEVGTGFHGELTGRENIFLSGAILGMRRAELLSRFDDIVDFADIGAFLDTPVKRYSSGMKVRLGFAVAAFLEPEILIVDEVLAVGDAEFQKRSLGKMSELGAGGRTVLFVSHNLPAVAQLCSRAILLEHGSVAADGPTHETTRRYLSAEFSPPRSIRIWADPATAPGDEVARLRSIKVESVGGDWSGEFDITKPIETTVEYVTQAPGAVRPSVSLHFFDLDGVCLFATNDWNDRKWWPSDRRPAVVRATCRIPGNFLAEGQVSVTAILGTYTPPHTHAIEKDAVVFTVADRTTGEGARGIFKDSWPGVVRPLLEWQVEEVERL